MTERVDAAMDRLEPSGRNAVLDAVASEAERDELRSRDDPVLRVGQVGERQVDGALTGHIPVKAPAATSRP